MLTAGEITVILHALNHKYGFGYSSVEEETNYGEISVGTLQAKLSIMAEMAAKKEAGK